MKFAMTRKYPPPKYHVFVGRVQGILRLCWVLFCSFGTNLGVDMEGLAKECALRWLPGAIVSLPLVYGSRRTIL